MKQISGEKMKIDAICETDGNGLWTLFAGATHIVEIYLNWTDSSYGELHAVLEGWNPQNSLVYTDDKWMADFRKVLLSLGLSEKSVAAVDYSEAGMQGKDFVSMDCGKAFFENNPLLEQLVKPKQEQKIEQPKAPVKEEIKELFEELLAAWTVSDWSEIERQDELNKKNHELRRDDYRRRIDEIISTM